MGPQDSIQVRLKHVAVIAAAACTTAALAACGSSSGSGAGGGDSGTITIGVVAAMTGAGASIGTEDVAGARLAVTNINAAAGTKGKKIVLKVEDDASSASQGITLLKSFASDQSVDLVLGMDTSADDVPFAGIANSVKIFTGAVGSTSSKIRAAGPWAMSMSAPEADMIAPLAEYALKTGDKTFSMITDNDNQGFVSQSDLFASTVTKGGAKVLANVNTTSANPDMSTAVAKLSGGHPDGILLDILANQGASFIQKYKAESSAPAHFYGPISLFSPAFLKAGGSAVNGTIVASDYGYDTNSAAKSFAQQFQQKYNRPASDFAAIGYASVEYVAARLAKASDNPSRQQVQTLMTAAGNQQSILGQTGTSTTDSSGVIHYKYVILEVKNGAFAAAG
jgi:branched-chain amino acid transport system substrate-binding protein